MDVMKRPRRTARDWLIAAAVLAAFAALWALVLLFMPPVAGAASLPPGHWLIQDKDLALIRANGTTASFQWVMCYPNTAGQDLSCPVPTFTSYYKFAAWVNHGGTGTVEIDYESGRNVTPPWQMAHEMRYVRLAAQLAAAHGIRAIFSPIPPPGAAPAMMLTLDVQAARYGAYAVDIQRHWMVHHPWQYASLLRSWVPAIKTAGPGTLVIAGMSTAPSGHPATAWQLHKTWQLTHGIPGLAGYWLITPVWPAGDGCAPRGCYGAAVRFLAEIGA